jgi:hypothetical protein
MAAQKVGVRLSGGFSPGTKVVLHRRYGSTFDAASAGATLDRKKVAADGTVMFDGLELGAGYWIAALDEDTGEWRARAMTAKPQTDSADKLGENEVAERLAQTRPSATAVRTGAAVTGPRSTSSARPHRVLSGSGSPFAHPATGLPTPKGDRDARPAPYVRIEDVPEGTPLRSHTVTGEAHPVNPDLPDGKLRQDQVPEGVPQASATPLGEATIVGDEDQAAARLEQKVPASQASPQPDDLPKREANSEKKAEERRTSAPAPKTEGIKAAQRGKPTTAAKRSAQGKTPSAPRSSGQRARKASPRRGK